MSKELIERLRDEIRRTAELDMMHHEAADLIEAQQKRIEELVENILKLDSVFVKNKGYLAASQAQIKVLRDVIQDEWDYQERNYSEPSLALMLALQEPTDDSALQAAILAEREACAVVCMQQCSVIEEPHEFERCAAAIRARGDSK